MFNEKIPFIFISYSHRDSDRVCPIIERLRKEGFNVWYDDGIEPGSEWDENIANHISQCGYFIAFISENYLGSSNCKDELNFARDLDKDRLLVYLEEVALSGGMAMRMNRNQAIYWDKCADKEKAYQKLFSAVGIEKTRVFIPKPAEQPAPAPQPVQPRPVQQPMPAPQPVQPRPAQQSAQPRPVQQPMPVQQPVARPMQQPKPVQQPMPVQQPAPKSVPQPAPTQQPVARPVQQPTSMQHPMSKSVQPQQPSAPMQPKNIKKQSSGLKIGLIIGGIILALLLVAFVSITILIVIGSSSSSNNEVVIEEDATVNDLLPLAEGGHTGAMYRLGEMYYYGENGAEVDYDKSFYWMNKAAESEHYDALKFLMFMYYLDGSPLEYDFAKSIEYAQKVLEQNPEDADAMFTIGYCYTVGGYGVEIDYEEAVVWYTKAAELGEADAMYNLALCYYYGYGVEVDQEKGDMWMQAYEAATEH